MADDWARLDRTKRFYGCVGALDGLIIAIHKPRLSETTCPASYKNRKGNFAIIAQARARAVMYVVGVFRVEGCREGGGVSL